MSRERRGLIARYGLALATCELFAITLIVDAQKNPAMPDKPVKWKCYLTSTGSGTVYTSRDKVLEEAMAEVTDRCTKEEGAGNCTEIPFCEVE